jgi:aerotaxis receptor
MRTNLPITQHEFDYPEHQMLVSSTDTKGFITHCNEAFVHVSGYTYDELVGQNHNLIRHPDCRPRPTKTCGAPLGAVGHGPGW